MNTSTIDRHIEMTPEIVGGKPRIAGRRITVQNIAIWHEYMGMRADEITAEYDLSLAEVYAALAYYFDHRAEIEEQIAEDKAFADALQTGTVSIFQSKLNRQSRE